MGSSVSIQKKQIDQKARHTPSFRVKKDRNVKAKSGLNRSILDQGWGEFAKQLGYKLDWNGGELLKVSPHNIPVEPALNWSVAMFVLEIKKTSLFSSVSSAATLKMQA